MVVFGDIMRDGPLNHWSLTMLGRTFTQIVPSSMLSKGSDRGTMRLQTMTTPLTHAAVEQIVYIILR